MIIDILLMNNDGVLVKTLWAYHKKNNIPKEYKQRTWTIPELGNSHLHHIPGLFW